MIDLIKLNLYNERVSRYEILIRRYTYGLAITFLLKLNRLLKRLLRCLCFKIDIYENAPILKYTKKNIASCHNIRQGAILVYRLE